jgi:hypothetical protein
VSKSVEVKKTSQHASSSASFDEFKLVFDSAEKITDRRLELNKTNASLCLATTAGIAGTLAWAHDKNDAIPFALIAVTFVAMLAAAVCRWWWRQIESYKDLNTAKFKVLNSMAPMVRFSESDLRSFEPFAKEWEELQTSNALRKVRGVWALGASWSELVVPKCFLFVYLVIIVVSVAAFFLKRYDIVVLQAIGL